MAANSSPDTEELVERAGGGDERARQQLLTRHWARLRRMVAVHLDRRLSARLDPSDVVQEALADAGQHLDEFLRDRPLPFYAWLRQFAWDRLVDVRRRHIHARGRSVDREEAWSMPLPDESAVALAKQLLAHGTSPSHRLIREESRGRVQAALARLSARDREILVLRHLEQLSAGETASVLQLSVAAVKARHTRALVRLRTLFDGPPGEDLR
jgi:RNA polymerase sigma-70 factor (ECF subfamily)